MHYLLHRHFRSYQRKAFRHRNPSRGKQFRSCEIWGYHSGTRI